jgi:hypothetical protein
MDGPGTEEIMLYRYRLHHDDGSDAGEAPLRLRYQPRRDDLDG